MGVATCPKYGTHQMKNQGTSAVRDYATKEIISHFKAPFWYKCDCNELFMSTGHAHFDGYPIGYYCTHGAIKGSGMVGGVYVWYVDSNLIYYTTATSYAGYRFIAA
jgi:hypothetical protein